MLNTILHKLLSYVFFLSFSLSETLPLSNQSLLCSLSSNSVVQVSCLLLHRTSKDHLSVKQHDCVCRGFFFLLLLLLLGGFDLGFAVNQISVGGTLSTALTKCSTQLFCSISNSKVEKKKKRNKKSVTYRRVFHNSTNIQRGFDNLI